MPVVVVQPIDRDAPFSEEEARENWIPENPKVKVVLHDDQAPHTDDGANDKASPR